MLAAQLSLFLGLFSSMALATTLPATINTLASIRSSDGNATSNCGDSCTEIVKGASCDGQDTDCVCEIGFKPTAQLYKCLFDKCPIDGAAAALSLVEFACGNDLNLTSGPPSGSMTETPFATPTAVESDVPTVAPAAAFTLPSCGSSCINAANAPECANSLDPACVCGLSSVSLLKCFFDSCDEAGAANSVNGFGVNCGLLPPQLPVSQWSYPFKNFAAANTTHSNGVGLTQIGSPTLLTFAAALIGTALL